MPDDSGGRPVASGIPRPEEDLTAYLQELQMHLQPLTRSAAQLPGPSDLSFHRSLDKSFARELEGAKEEVVATLNGLMDLISASGKGSALGVNDVVDSGRFERHFGDAIDTLLERTDMRLDEYFGKRAVQSARKTTAPNATAATAVISTGPLPAHILNAPIKPPPQDRFTKQPDNSRNQRWTHMLLEKPNSLVPLSWKPPAEEGDDDGQRIVGVRRGMYCSEGDPHENPYYYEIGQFQPPRHALNVPLIEDLAPPPPLTKDDPTTGPYTWVFDQSSFDKLYDHLMESRVQEIAVDVEHHNFHSYQGLVCLVQISTRWQDFIIDALSPFIRDTAFKLNVAFTDPNKVKILHGAEHDVLWLQRDLGLYLVGLFDTFHATNVLNFSQHGLAFLLNRYIDFVADKRYQLADWRIRPLPKEMLYYARSDTHTLIHVYDCLRFELEKAEGLQGIQTVFELSKKTAAKTYALEEWNDDAEGREGWRSMWRKLAGEEALTTDVRFEKEGLMGLTLTERLFRSLHDWRDRAARKEDESARFILNSANLLNLASRAPDSKESVIACIGSALKKRSAELFKLIVAEKKAYEEAKKSQTAQQRALLEQAAAGVSDIEELGNVVGMGRSGSSITLWPTNPSSEGLRDRSGDSPLSNLLFGKRSARSSVQERGGSLFAPATSATSSRRLVESIRSDLATALSGMTGLHQLDPIDSTHSNGATDGIAGEVEVALASSPAITAEDVKAPAGGLQTDTPANQIDDGIVQVRRKKDKRGAGSRGAQATDEAASASGASVKEAKKRKWTKEEKAERKRLIREQQDAIVPFDYSTATSVLDRPDAKKPSAGQKQAKKGERKAGKEGGRDGGNTLHGTSSKQGRYSNVAVGRDRKEQAGGKSMTFSQ